MLIAQRHIAAREVTARPVARLALDHADRHMRRKVLTLSDNQQVMVDFPQAIRLAGGDHLALADGREIVIEAVPEPLYEITARCPNHHAELCWHIGNRHVPASITADHILIGRDPVLKTMLTGLGAAVNEIVAPFQPLDGAYHAHHHDKR